MVKCFYRSSAPSVIIFGSLVLRVACTLSTLLENLVMVRKIKPQRAQRITESCYFYLSHPLCLSVSSVVFRNLISKISKSLMGFWSLQREISKTLIFIAREYRIAIGRPINIPEWLR